jgi:hypothetical protein
MIDNSRGPGLAAPMRGRQVPPLGPQEIDRLIATQERDGPIAMDDDPSWHRRHDDIDPEKRAFWAGATWGWCVGVVMTAAAVAWRLAP